MSNTLLRPHGSIPFRLPVARYRFWPGARSDGLPVAWRQLGATGVSARCARFAFTKSVPKYEKPGDVPSGLTQWAAEAGPATISEDITANTQAKTIFFFFMCRFTPFPLLTPWYVCKTPTVHSQRDSLNIRG